MHACMQGLMSYDLEARTLRVLANAVAASSPLDASMPITYANDLDIAADGTVYFSASQVSLHVRASKSPT